MAPLQRILEATSIIEAPLFLSHIYVKIYEEKAILRLLLMGYTRHIVVFQVDCHFNCIGCSLYYST